MTNIFAHCMPSAINKILIKICKTDQDIVDHFSLSFKRGDGQKWTEAEIML